ncbi:hypothetical protein Pmani_021119 [Petrolisthes manimaculis]|uniref:Uncharacterized protein n=1 Tax=Petrolisthes manimaculis TaxID=1843537 RepID=A0AAE1PHB0_9EUCA|nr:hypothetical protein Pmani_021119 [Petrolisthes manimaculis]
MTYDDQLKSKNQLIVKITSEDFKASEKKKEIANDLNSVPNQNTKITKISDVVAEFRDQTTLQRAVGMIKKGESKLRVTAATKEKLRPKFKIMHVSVDEDEKVFIDFIVEK